jgi:probable F420-dependent oxidoreductase
MARSFPMGMKVLYRLNSKDLKDIQEEARWAERMGYDGVTSSETAHDPFFPLVLAATATSSVTLDTRVAIAFPRSPMTVAYAARDLQDASEGRFRLGLGTQVKGHIQRRFSTEWGSPGPRLREYVQSLHAIWDTWQEGTKLDYHGDFYNFTLMTPFFSPGPSPYARPEVFIAAINKYNCQVAGEVCDGLALHGLNSDKYLKDVIVPSVEKGAQKMGRTLKDVKLSGGGFVITGPNRATIEEKKQAVKQQISFYSSTRTYFPVLEAHGYQEVGQQLHEMSLKGRWEEMGGLISDEMLESFATIGDYEEIGYKLKERFDGVLDEVGFTMPASSPADEGILKRIIELLKS